MRRQLKLPDDPARARRHNARVEEDGAMHELLGAKTPEAKATAMARLTAAKAELKAANAVVRKATKEKKNAEAAAAVMAQPLVISPTIEESIASLGDTLSNVLGAHDALHRLAYAKVQEAMGARTVNVTSTPVVPTPSTPTPKPQLKSKSETPNPMTDAENQAEAELLNKLQDAALLDLELAEAEFKVAKTTEARLAASRHMTKANDEMTDIAGRIARHNDNITHSASALGVEEVVPEPVAAPTPKAAPKLSLPPKPAAAAATAAPAKPKVAAAPVIPTPTASAATPITSVVVTSNGGNTPSSTPSNTGVAGTTSEIAFAKGFSGEVTARDVQVPFLKLIQPTSPALKNGKVMGSYILGDHDLAVPTRIIIVAGKKDFVECLEYDPEAEVQPRSFRSMDEVHAAGLHCDWNGDPLTRCAPRLNTLLLIEGQGGPFGIQLAGSTWALGAWSIRGLSYTRAGRTVIGAATRTLAHRSLSDGIFTLEKPLGIQTSRGNIVYASMVSFGGLSKPEVIAEIAELGVHDVFV